MLIFKKIDENTGSEERTLTIMGEEITLMIRPLNDRVLESLRKKYKKETALTDAMIDHVLESFEGVGDESGMWEVNLENKKRVMSIPAVDGGASVADFVFNEAKKLAFDRREAEIKN